MLGQAAKVAACLLAVAVEHVISWSSLVSWMRMLSALKSPPDQDGAAPLHGSDDISIARVASSKTSSKHVSSCQAVGKCMLTKMHSWPFELHLRIWKRFALAAAIFCMEALHCTPNITTVSHLLLRL